MLQKTACRLKAAQMCFGLHGNSLETTADSGVKLFIVFCSV